MFHLVEVAAAYLGTALKCMPLWSLVYASVMAGAFLVSVLTERNPFASKVHGKQCQGEIMPPSSQVWEDDAFFKGSRCFVKEETRTRNGHDQLCVGIALGHWLDEYLLIVWLWLRTLKSICGCGLIENWSAGWLQLGICNWFKGQRSRNSRRHVVHWRALYMFMHPSIFY